MFALSFRVFGSDFGYLEVEMGVFCLVWSFAGH